MTPLLFALCVLMGVSLAVGQVLFKLSARHIDSVWAAAGSPQLFAAIFLYGATTALWVYILTRLSLSTAYPFSLLGAALVPVLAYFVLGEAISAKTIAGMALMIAGLSVIYVF